MPLSVPCTSCKRLYALDEQLYQSRVASHVVSFRCKECGATATIDGTRGEKPKTLDEGEEVIATLSGDDLGPDPTEIDEIDDEEVASLPPDSLKALGASPGAAERGEDESLWVINEEEGAADEELQQSTLVARIQAGKIPADAIVWREGMSDWLPVADVPMLAKHLPSTRQDKTGGFLGTGMKADFSGKEGDKPRGESKSVPPPLPPKKKSSDPRSGKPIALSRGLLFSVDDDETVPEKTPPPDAAEPKRFAPKPPLKSKPAVTRDLDFSDIGDEEPIPSSVGTPALKALTSKVPPVPQKKSSDDFLVSLGGGEEEVLGPPSIDISDLGRRVDAPAPRNEAPDSSPPESASAPGSVSKKKKKKKKKSKKKAGASRAPAATPSQRPRPSQPAKAEQAPSEERSGAFLKVLVLAAIAAGILFFVTRHKASPPAEPSQPATPPAAAQNKPAEVETRPTAEPPKEPAPSDSDQRVDESEAKQRPATAETARAVTPKATGAAVQPKAGAAAETAAAPKQAPEKPAEKKEEKPKETGKKPEAASDLPPFDKGAAVAALNAAVAQASGCRQPGDPSGTARVVITFAPSGRVTSANLSGPPFAGTRTGGCIASTMRRARVPAFSGAFVTVSKSVVIR